MAQQTPALRIECSSTEPQNLWNQHHPPSDCSYDTLLLSISAAQYVYPYRWLSGRRFFFRDAAIMRIYLVQFPDRGEGFIRSTTAFCGWASSLDRAPGTQSVRTDHVPAPRISFSSCLCPVHVRASARYGSTVGYHVPGANLGTRRYHASHA
jgi:hypothetical protein